MTIDDQGRLIPDTGCPPPGWRAQTAAMPHTITHHVQRSIAEQLGTDPISKLAAALHDLADAIRKGGGGSAG